jgi:hypothetical protein
VRGRVLEVVCRELFEGEAFVLGLEFLIGVEGLLVGLSTTARGVGEECLVTVHFKYNSYEDRKEQGSFQGERICCS